MQITPQQKRQQERIANILEGNKIGVITELNSLEKQINDLNERLIQTIQKVERMDIPDWYIPVKGVDYEDGKDYILTDQDKKDIAESITVPVVEKVIEKRTETIIEKQQPIINEITKETRIENPFELVGESIIEKINELPTDVDEYKIDASHIKNLPKSSIVNNQSISSRVGVQVYSSGSKIGTKTMDLNFSGDGVSVENVNGMTNVSIAGGSGTITVEIPVGVKNGVNNRFTVTHTPKWIVLDGQQFFAKEAGSEQGYTLLGLTILLDKTLAPRADSVLRSVY